MSNEQTTGHTEQVSIEQIELSLESLAMTPEEAELVTAKRTWEEIISAMMTALSTEGISNWTLGDLGNEIERTFGTNQDQFGNTPLAKAAITIGEKPSSLRQRTWVSCTYPDRSRRKTGLSWTHYRSAASSDDPMGWINKAVDNNWTVTQLEAELKAAGEMKAVALGSCAVCGGLLTIDNARHVRFQNKKETSICSAVCLCEFYEPMKQIEQARKSAESATLGETMSVVSGNVPQVSAPTAKDKRSPNYVPTPEDLESLDGMGIFGDDVIETIRNMHRDTAAVGA